jgi:hypothetical protein
MASTAVGTGSSDRNTGLNPLRMARGHPHREPTSEKTPHDPAAKEAGPTEHGDQSPMLEGAPVRACGRSHHVGSTVNVLDKVIY